MPFTSNICTWVSQWSNFTHLSRWIFWCMLKNNIVCISDISSIKYMPRQIKPTRNLYRVTCVYRTYIGSILLQSDLNKLQLSQTFFWRYFKKFHQNVWFSIWNIYMRYTEMRLFQWFTHWSYIIWFHVILSFFSAMT